MNAYIAVCKNDPSETLRKYSGFILDAYDANCNIRKSCYSSGMLLCLILDEILPEWKMSFFNSDKSLYTFLKQNINVVLSLNNEIAISKESKSFILFKMKETRILSNFMVKKGMICI